MSKVLVAHVDAAGLEDESGFIVLNPDLVHELPEWLAKSTAVKQAGFFRAVANISSHLLLHWLFLEDPTRGEAGDLGFAYAEVDLEVLRRRAESFTMGAVRLEPWLALEVVLPTGLYLTVEYKHAGGSLFSGDLTAHIDRLRP